MLADDLMNNGQAQAGAGGFGGKKRIEDAGQDICGNALAVVFDLQFHQALVG